MSNEFRRGSLFVVSAPSATGKTSVLRGLLQGEVGCSLRYSVSHTTRAPRPGEVEGRDYHFVSDAEFDATLAGDGFLEWAQIYGHRSGTARSEVEPRLAAGEDVLVDVDVQGARQIFERLPEAIGIFLLPPSYAELEARLRGRGADSEESIARRLRSASDEVSCYQNYRYVIVNVRLDQAIAAVEAVITASRHRLEVMREISRSIAATFPGATSPGIGSAATQELD